MNVNEPPLSVGDLLRLARAGDADALEKLVRMAEQGGEAEKRAEDAEKRIKEAEKRAEEAEKRAKDAEKQIEEAETRASKAEAKNRILKYVWLMKHRCSMQYRCFT